MSSVLTVLRRQRGPVIGLAAFVVVALMLTALVTGTLVRGVSGASTRYEAIFSDATGLSAGDEVRIAGVKVGQVDRVALDGHRARVVFSVVDQPVYDHTIATVDFLNLMGERYVDLSVGTDHGRELKEGATLPVERTRQGLDLTALFNAFKPLFDALRPADVNQLADNIIRALQGEGPTLRDLTAQTAKLTSHLADRDEVIGQVITNVTTVMRTVDTHRDQIRGLVNDLDHLTATVADNRDKIGRTIDSVQDLTTTFSSLLDAGAADVNRDVDALAAWSTSFAEQAPRLARALTWTQDLLVGYIKTLGLGSYLNTYVCKFNLRVQSGGQGLTLPVMPHGQSSERCR